MDKPILFSAPMVRALLAGTKTQTRRVAKITAIMGNKVAVYPPEELIELSEGEFREGVCHYASTNALSGPYNLSYAVGDRLWAKEAWRTESRAYDDLKPSDMDADYSILYDADADWRLNKSTGRTRSSIHMPRWASRLTLTVTDMRVQRLQDINEEDALAEGVSDFSALSRAAGCDMAKAQTELRWAQRLYAALWDQINGPGAWNTNPWVVALTFDVRKGNIDA